MTNRNKIKLGSIIIGLLRNIYLYFKGSLGIESGFTVGLVLNNTGNILVWWYNTNSGEDILGIKWREVSVVEDKVSIVPDRTIKIIKHKLYYILMVRIHSIVVISCPFTVESSTFLVYVYRASMHGITLQPKEHTTQNGDPSHIYSVNKKWWIYTGNGDG